MCPALRASAPLVLVGAVGLTIVSARPAAQMPAVETIMARAGGYVSRFVEAFSNVVAAERYVQEVATEAPLPTAMSGSRVAVTLARTRRDLRSDFLLLRAGGPLEWRPFRDVFEVDGRTIRDRDDRLATLFLNPSPTAIEQAARIAQESARYNIGLAGRTVNTPILSLLFLQSHIQPRFRFELDRREAGVGPNVWRVAYTEVVVPTLIRGIAANDDRDLPSSGHYWIDTQTGRVARAELRLSTATVTAAIVTNFRDDARFGIAVPVEMREQYQIAENPQRRQPARTVSGLARYDEFRRFDVHTDATLAAPLDAKP
jgi:hypothetical protein